MKHIVIFEPIGSGASLVLEAKQMGHFVTVVGLNEKDRCLSKMVLEALDNLVKQDSNDETKTIECLISLHRKKPINAVIAGNEYYVPLVAKVAEKLGLLGLNPKRAIALHDKYEMRCALQRNGIRVPFFCQISSEKDIEEKREILTFPLVLKPVAAAGSFHVTKVETLEELVNAYQRAQAEVHQELEHDIGESMLLEEYLYSPEYSLEGYISDQGPVVLSITEKFLGAEPTFVECGHIVQEPTLLDEKGAIQNYLHEVVNALSLKLGVFHAEIRFDKKRQPVLIEVGARLPGDRIVELIELAGGESMSQLSIKAHLGENLSGKTKPLDCITGVAFFLPNTSFSIENAPNHFSQVECLDGYVANTLSLNPNINQKNTHDYRSRLGSAIFRKKDYLSVRQTIQSCTE